MQWLMLPPLVIISIMVFVRRSAGVRLKDVGPLSPAWLAEQRAQGDLDFR